MRPIACSRSKQCGNGVVDHDGPWRQPVDFEDAGYIGGADDERRSVDLGGYRALRRDDFDIAAIAERRRGSRRPAARARRAFAGTSHRISRRGSIRRSDGNRSVAVPIAPSPTKAIGFIRQSFRAAARAAEIAVKTMALAVVAWPVVIATPWRGCRRAPEIRDRGNEPGQRGGPGAEPARVVRRRVDGRASPPRHRRSDRCRSAAPPRGRSCPAATRQTAPHCGSSARGNWRRSGFLGADASSSRQEIVRQVGDGRAVDRIERSLGTHHRQRTPALFADRRSKENIALARLDGRAGGQPGPATNCAIAATVGARSSAAAPRRALQTSLMRAR